MSRFFGRRKDDKSAVAEPAPAPVTETFKPEVSGNVLETNDFRSPSDLLGQQKDGSRLYNPYAGLGNQGFDLSRTLLELPDAPEFVFSEEALVRHRGWSENLTYITGGAYMGGALAGGAYGGYRALTTKVEGIPDTTKLRVNRVLNVGGGFGRNLGNNLGVLGLFYSTFESLSSYVREEHDSLNSIIAAGGTGAMYKCVSGPRAAAVWGAGGAVVATMLVAGNKAVDLVLH